MGRIHARKKGTSGSKRPVKVDLSFVKISTKEVEKIIVDMANDDAPASRIGIVLRDSYGVPSVKALTGKSITQILEEKNVKPNIPEDLQALVNKANNLKKHLEANKRDTHNKRGLILLTSKIRRLAKYYKKKGVLEVNWNFN